jgi:PIN domain nuclease of toxin-antitoxin system
MDLLLDTQAFLWWQTSSSRLSDAARAAIANPANVVFVSAASVWEIAIKRRSGKLAFDAPVAAAIAVNGFVELPMLALDAEAAGDLDWRHTDPFDRLLVAQAVSRSLTLVTSDRAIRSFGAVPQLSAG